MQFHQGLRLKKIIEKSGLSKADIINKSGVNNSTLYNFFNYEQLLPKKIKPILDVLGMSVDEFYFGKASPSHENIEAMQREIELLKQQLAAKDEIIELLKVKQKK